MVPTTTYPSLVWVHAVGPQGREEETAAALGVLAAQTHDSHRVRSDRAPQMGPQAHTRPYRPFQNVTTVTRLWGKLSGYSPKTARNMAGRPSGKSRRRADSRPFWAASKGWTDPQDAVWAMIGHVDTVMPSDDEICGRKPLQHNKPLLPGIPPHYKNPNVTSCMACNGKAGRLGSRPRSLPDCGQIAVLLPESIPVS